jgi:hypothetical protein
LAQLHFNDDGLMVELPKSKTKQKGEAEEKAIFFPLIGAVTRCGR